MVGGALAHWKLLWRCLFGVAVCSCESSGAAAPRASAAPPSPASSSPKSLVSAAEALGDAATPAQLPLAPGARSSAATFAEKPAGAAEGVALGGAQAWVGSCWQGGYTRDLCCRERPVVNCWDAVFTFRRCCGPPTPPSQGAAAGAPAHVPGGDDAAAGGGAGHLEGEVGAQPPAAQRQADGLAGAVRKDGDPDTAEGGTGIAQGGEASSCWAGGYTFARCCKVPSIVSTIDGCWNDNRTEDLCCGSPEVGTASASSGASSGGQGTGEAAIPRVGPIHDETLADRSLLAATPANSTTPASVNMTASVAIAGVLAAVAAATTASGASSSAATVADGTAASAVGASGRSQGITDGRHEGASGIRDLSAADVAAAFATRAVEQQSATSGVSPEDAARTAPFWGDAATEGGQARFFQREGSRRWATYFRKAHQLLNEVQTNAGAAAGGSSASGATRDAASAPPDGGTNGHGERSTSMDAVQLYHLLYEVVNQVIGGIQLATEASGSPAPDALLGGGSGGSGAALRAAFLSASVVLARLAQASHGTPLEHEEFGAQAGAAMTLSCRHQQDAVFQEDLANRIVWLQREAAASSGATGPGTSWSAPLLDSLRRRLNRSGDNDSDTAASGEGSDGAENMEAMFRRSWQMYAEDLVEAVWRPAGLMDDGRSIMEHSTLDPLDERLTRGGYGQSQVWQIFSTYVMAKPLAGALQKPFASGPAENGADEDSLGCPACAELTRIVMDKYSEFELQMQNASHTPPGGTANGADAGRSSGARSWRRRMRADEVNNAFFAWQLTHESEQEERGAEVWPELYQNSREFVMLKHLAKMACLEYLQQVYDASLSSLDLAQLELSMWASVTPPGEDAPNSRATSASAMGLAFHDHPLALLSGVFYAQAGGRGAEERTPTAFADPRGTAAFRYTRGSKRQQRAIPEDPLEPTAPFHRLAYAHASDGLALVFPSWLVHGVPPHMGSSARVTFAFNLHTLQGTTLSSWAKTAL
mmetsp:Transcript_111052/g.313207  ORF Transcript_111052/g.313207 Transcript_111052/m.313207 type:complete len:991 (+) Transcript_111052:132-3104(+)